MRASNVLLWVATSVATLALVGCAADTSASSVENRQLFEKRVGADETKAKAFVESLASMPFPQRDAYAKQHPADIRNMALIPDPTLQTKFRNLMTNRG